MFTARKYYNNIIPSLFFLGIFVWIGIKAVDYIGTEYAMFSVFEDQKIGHALTFIWFSNFILRPLALLTFLFGPYVIENPLVDFGYYYKRSAFKTILSYSIGIAFSLILPLGDFSVTFIAMYINDSPQLVITAIAGGIFGLLGIRGLLNPKTNYKTGTSIIWTVITSIPVAVSIAHFLFS